MFRKLLIANTIAAMMILIEVNSVAWAWPEQLLLEGELISYTSICEIENPTFGPLNITIPIGTMVSIEEECEKLEAELQQPLALILRVRNLDDSGHPFTMPSLTDIVINDGTSRRSAFALKFPWRLSATTGPGWATTIAAFESGVSPNAVKQFLYLIPNFSGKVTIEVGDISSFEIRNKIGLSVVMPRSKLPIAWGRIKVQ